MISDTEPAVSMKAAFFGTGTFLEAAFDWCRRDTARKIGQAPHCDRLLLILLNRSSASYIHISFCIHESIVEEDDAIVKSVFLAWFFLPGDFLAINLDEHG
jgi:hypothetical protein